MHHDGFDTQLAAGALDAQGDLTPICNQNFSNIWLTFCVKGET